jgi:hemolysin III
VFAASLIALYAASTIYHALPPSRVKQVFRVLDHVTIYLLIAGTYTPFLAQLKIGLASTCLGIGIWSSAVLGMILKLALPGRFDRVAIVLFLLLGWSGAITSDLLT